MDSLLIKLMTYIINTGCLTRYSFFHPTSYPDSYFVKYHLNVRYYYSEFQLLL